MGKKDGLVVAGDLFDTHYGSYSNPDFSPEAIKKDLCFFLHPFYYVYGNCDSETFAPGHKNKMIFEAFGKKMYLHHGHRAFNSREDVDIVIQGHTHLCSLEKIDNRIFMNPGSICRPRNSLMTYGVMDTSAISLVELKTGRILASINL